MTQKKIMVVDDTRFMVAAITEVLEEAGYAVASASSGEMALDIIKREKPDLVLLDVVMTGISGYDVLQKLREDFRFNLTPIIMLTGQSEEEAKLKGLEMGADDYIVKPFIKRELLARVKNTLVRLEKSRGANPLTGLKGNNEIELELLKRIETESDYAVLYCDLNSFKPYNDVYGFANGDIAIKMTADVISDAVGFFDNDTDFVGHIGGDDFIVITEKERAIPIAEKIIEGFEQEKLALYTEEDREKGYITAKDRTGKVMNFELIGLSVAIVFGERHSISGTAELAEIAAVYKKKAKAAGKSAYAC